MIKRDCKRCLLREMAENATLADIKDRIAKLPESEKVTDEVYNSRLSACRECSELISGVCMKCGCYVEFRASFKNNDCPDVKNRKW